MFKFKNKHPTLQEQINNEEYVRSSAIENLQEQINALKLKDKNMYEEQEITWENLAETLEYNGWKLGAVGSEDGMALKEWINFELDNSILYRKNKIIVLAINRQDLLEIDSSNTNWLAHLELEIGKLKPIPKKEEKSLYDVLVGMGFVFVEDYSLRKKLITINMEKKNFSAIKLQKLRLRDSEYTYSLSIHLPYSRCQKEIFEITDQETINRVLKAINILENWNEYGK